MKLVQMVFKNGRSTTIISIQDFQVQAFICDCFSHNCLKRPSLFTRVLNAALRHLASLQNDNQVGILHRLQAVRHQAGQPYLLDHFLQAGRGGGAFEGQVFAQRPVENGWFLRDISDPRLVIGMDQNMVEDRQGNVTGQWGIQVTQLFCGGKAIDQTLKEHQRILTHKGLRNAHYK
jgi:hypothetical protein